MSLSTLFQIYRAGQLYWWRKTADLPHFIDNKMEM